MKRRRGASGRFTSGDQLTGGSGDVNPQFLHMTITQSGADTTTSAQINLPVTRLPQSNVVTIIELLKIYVDMPVVVGEAAGLASNSLAVNFSTTNGGATANAFSDPDVLAAYEVQKRTAFTAAQGFAAVESGGPQTPIDLTDGAGHGVLVATDNAFIQCVSVATGVANTVNAKWLYRFKTVSLVEYVGIVQSQQ